MPPKKRGIGSNSDVQLARGRLKGALQDVVSTQDSEDDEEIPMPKRLKPAPLPIRQAFIMKLFDRSVDLAKYNQKTALYPVCRAWMQNQPRSVKILNLNQYSPPVPSPREKLSNIVDDLKSGRVMNITEMPAANKDTEMDRIPSPLPFHKNINKDNIDLNYDLDDPPVSRDKLLNELKSNCQRVRKKWQSQNKAYAQDKYGLSLRVLETIYKP